MIVRSPRDFFYDNLGTKIVRRCRETARAQSEIARTSHGHRMGFERFPLKCPDTLTFPCDFHIDASHNIIALSDLIILHVIVHKQNFRVNT